MPKELIDRDLLCYRLRRYISAEEQRQEDIKGDKLLLWKSKIFAQAYRTIILEIECMKGEVIDGNG